MQIYMVWVSEHPIQPIRWHWMLGQLLVDYRMRKENSGRWKKLDRSRLAWRKISSSSKSAFEIDYSMSPILKGFTWNFGWSMWHTSSLNRAAHWPSKYLPLKQYWMLHFILEVRVSKRPPYALKACDFSSPLLCAKENRMLELSS